MKRLFVILLLVASSAVAQQAPLEFEIAGMTCGTCAASATKALKKIKGVTSVSVDFETKRARVEAKRAIANDEIRSSLMKLGFEARFASDPDQQPIPPAERARLDIRATPTGAMIDLGRDLAAGKVTIVDFWAEWCGPCHLLTPKLEWMVHENAHVALRTVELTDWKSPAGIQATRQFRVPALPYVRVYDANQKYVGDVVGTDIDKIRKLVDAARKR